jgi:hypothetical protein
MIEKLLCKLFPYVDIKRLGESTVYLRRWFINPRVPDDKKLTPRIYLHKFYRGDEDPHLHNHPWAYRTLILKGGYWEVSFNPEWLKLKAKGLHKIALQTPQTVRKWYGAGTFMRRGAQWTHQVKLPEGKTAWTIVFTGKREHSWGFITDKGLCNHRYYHNGECEEGKVGVIVY